MSVASAIEAGEERLDALYAAIRLAAIEGRLCPSNTALSDATGYKSRDTISWALRRLIDAGELTVTREALVRVAHFPDGLHTANESTFAKVRDDVARALGVEPFKLVAGGRRRVVTHARFVAAWVLYHRFRGIGTTTVGKVLGGRDHSTIINALDRVEYQRERDSGFRAFTSALLTGQEPGAYTHSEVARPKKVKPLPYIAPLTSWCDQCQSRVTIERAARCGSRWCSMKAVA